MVVALATVGAVAYAVVAVWRRSWVMLVVLFAVVEGPLLALGASNGLSWMWETEVAQVSIAVFAVVFLGLAAIGLRKRNTVSAFVAVGLLVIPNAILAAGFLYCETTDDPAGCAWIPAFASLAVVPISLLVGGGFAFWSAVVPPYDPQ